MIELSDHDLKEVVVIEEELLRPSYVEEYKQETGRCRNKQIIFVNLLLDYGSALVNLDKHPLKFHKGKTRRVV